MTTLPASDKPQMLQCQGSSSFHGSIPVLAILVSMHARELLGRNMEGKRDQLFVAQEAYISDTDWTATLLMENPLIQLFIAFNSIKFRKSNNAKNAKKPKQKKTSTCHCRAVR